jgi:2-polyprenyl-3-methyl-5-hydroxy-6-metoxy-1,4-benzoquinol methylase
MSNKEPITPAANLETITSCRICGATAFRQAMVVSEWHLMQCQACDVVFTSPRYTSEALSTLYRSDYYESAADYFRSQAGQPTYDHLSIAKQAAKYVRGDKRCSVDIGTGAGRQVAAFAALGFRASGTEPSDVACQWAQQHGRDVVNVDVVNLPTQSFDCVTALHVLEHVAEPLDFVRHICRITKPGGVVILEVPNYASAASRRLGARWRALYPSTHLFHFTPNTLADVCQRAGLSVIATHRVGGAGLFRSLASADAPPTTHFASSSGPSNAGSPPSRSFKTIVWSMRTPFLRIPIVRPLLRWINWELLGQGEYVRIIARRQA